MDLETLRGRITYKSLLVKTVLTVDRYTTYTMGFVVDDVFCQDMESAEKHFRTILETLKEATKQDTTNSEPNSN